jgi:predicted nucleotidyltransferase
MENRLDSGIGSELEARRTDIESLCRRTKVVSLELFGSAASREFRAEASDLDFVVTFAEFPQVGMFDARSKRGTVGCRFSIAQGVVR